MRTGTILLLGGAAALGYHLIKVANAVKQLRVMVKGIRHSSSNLTTSKFIITLAAVNPNAVSIAFERIYAQVKIEGNFLGELDINGNGSTISPNATTDIEVPVYVDHFSGATTIYNIIKKIIAKEKFTTPFDVQGTLYAGGLQLPIASKVSLQSLGINGISDCFQCLIP